MSSTLIVTLPLAVEGGRRRLHVSRGARDRYGVAGDLLSVRGTLLFADLAAARSLAARMNEARDARHYPELAVRSGELFAAGLLHEVQHLVLARYREERPEAIAELLASARETLGDRLDGLLRAFAAEFPAPPHDGEAEAWLAGETEGVANREIAFEEMLLLRLANRNAAMERFRELFDDGALRERDAYELLIATAEGGLPAPEAVEVGRGGGGGRPRRGRPADTVGGALPAGGLLGFLEAPALASPTSLRGQIEYVRQNWSPILGTRLEAVLDRLLLSLDVLAEEAKHGWHGPAPMPPVPTGSDLRALGPAEEAERFSVDASWMPRVVLLAKSVHVWLDQLSRRYRRRIERLDQVPDEVLDEIAGRGFTTLWLIGLWERSEASRRIKHLRGQADAAASAYAIYDYVIAADLGGDEACRDLRDRAWERGLRLASDMVPNHVGLDGRWVVEHPERFIQLDRPPYPGYSFSGPDLSGDDRVAIYLEDHYYDNTDAAVVFKRVDRATGEERYIYHGNDGTAMPWNDTAQLDYLRADVREAVIETILDVARRFPVIRFDAAMTLARRHVRRLWYPEPGQGGAIPSRAEHGAMAAEEFDRAMPEEFWREVVDRVAREAPDTLLLAEAFWMLEGYFVRNLGMHRVYNSAFMNMLKHEANAEYRDLLENVLAFDPRILERFVNFMNNPDEDTAVAQFGKDDKYFGVCTLMCTMPGLPMFGHGQIEGFEEKYGMEFRRARRDELPDPWLLERHEREIFPLLHRRAQFAGAERFRLYDLIGDDGAVNEDVYAYSNVVDGQASLVFFHNRYAEASGRIRDALTVGGEAGGETDLLEALGLEGGSDRFVVYRDFGSGLEHLLGAEELRREGFRISLGAYQYRVLLDFREVRDSASEPFAELSRELSGRGVPSIRDALLDLRLRPVFDAFGDFLDTPLQDGDALRAAYRDFLAALHGSGVDAGVTTADPRERFGALLRACGSLLDAGGPVEERLEPLSAALVAWMALEPLERGTWARGRLEQELSAGHHAPAGHYPANLLAEAVPLILEYAPSAVGDVTASALLSALLDDERVTDFLRFNSHEGTEYFDRDAFRVLVDGVALAGAVLDLAAEGVKEDLAETLAALRRIEEGSGYRVSRLRKAAEVRSRPERARPGGGRSGA